MHYYTIEENSDIFLEEKCYNTKFIKKTESLFAQCNGFMGVRASFEFQTLEESRGLFVAGFFNKHANNQVEELVNCPDFTRISIEVDGEDVFIDRCEIVNYSRRLNLQTGELIFETELKTINNAHLLIKTKRFASKDDLSLFCHKVEITMLSGNSTICIDTGIDGSITNSGQSHFNYDNLRIYGGKTLHSASYIKKKKLISIFTECKFSKNEIRKDYYVKRKGIFGKYCFELAKNEPLTFCKYSYVKSNLNLDKDKNQFNQCVNKSYEDLLILHILKLNEFWKYAKIEIEGASIKEKAAILFSQYHIMGMTPFHTNKVGIAAKGLTGEGYKGHVFWDSEIFNLPMFQHVFPQIAKNNIIFRHNGLKGAKKKALEYGYKGAMYPWEVAKGGNEQTPKYAALNIYTGIANKIWSAIKEHHITADIAYSVWAYYLSTNDEETMIKYGYEIILECADFWCSRATWVKERECFEILDIIGPDEYTEHIDNNAYTNYLANYNVKIALQILTNTKSADNIRKDKYNKFLKYIYLPQHNSNGIIPQDDTFLNKKELSNIAKYKSAKAKQEILFDYSRQEIIEMQVLKQADVVMLLNLLPNLFSGNIQSKNIEFYEKRTIHDSSLSICVHSIAYARNNNSELAYKFFCKAIEIDVNNSPYISQDGIHAAALGGIWNCVIQGFCGLQFIDNILSINCALPANWKTVSFFLCISGVYFNVVAKSNSISLTSQTKSIKKIKLYVQNKLVEIVDSYYYKW